MDPQNVLFQDLGYQAYKPVWDYQEQLLQQNVAVKALAYAAGPATGSPLAETTHHLLLVEHPPVYTLGKSGNPGNLLITEAECASRGIAFYRINRGGDITFHGPGQVVGYPILDLERFYTDIGRYLRNVEEVIIRTLSDYGIDGDRSPGETGVWLDPQVRGRERKICAIGVRCSRWITMHGFAFNVNTDLSYFEHIVPCGIRDKQVTSLQRELSREMDLGEVRQRIRAHFEEVFSVRLLDAPDASAGPMG